MDATLRPTLFRGGIRLGVGPLARVEGGAEPYRQPVMVLPHLT